MKKLFLLLMAAILLSATSCSKIGNKSKVSGWYITEIQYTTGIGRKAIKFVNSNTLIDYGTIEKIEGTSHWADWIKWEKLPEKDGYYYQSQAGRQFTYYIVDNKIFYTGSDTAYIITINEDGTLQYDGEKNVYRKW